MGNDCVLWRGGHRVGRVGTDRRTDARESRDRYAARRSNCGCAVWRFRERPPRAEGISRHRLVVIDQRQHQREVRARRRSERLRELLHAADAPLRRKRPVQPGARPARRIRVQSRFLRVGGGRNTADIRVFGGCSGDSRQRSCAGRPWIQPGAGVDFFIRSGITIRDQLDYCFVRGAGHGLSGSRALVGIVFGPS